MSGIRRQLKKSRQWVAQKALDAYDEKFPTPAEAALDVAAVAVAVAYTAPILIVTGGVYLAYKTAEFAITPRRVLRRWATEDDQKNIPNK